MRRSNYVELDRDTTLASMSHTETEQQETQDLDQEPSMLRAEQNRCEKSKVGNEDVRTRMKHAEAHPCLIVDVDWEMNREHTAMKVAKRQNVDVVN